MRTSSTGLPEATSLDDAFTAQRALQIESYGSDPGALPKDEAIEFIRWNILALEDELHEALGEVGWKPWATSSHINIRPYKGELVDAFHFFMNLCLVVGMTGDELLELYLEKRAINARRQEQGYDGVSEKCPKCHRALDDPGAGGCQYNRATGRGNCSVVGVYVQ